MDTHKNDESAKGPEQDGQKTRSGEPQKREKAASDRLAQALKRKYPYKDVQEVRDRLIGDVINPYRLGKIDEAEAESGWKKITDEDPPLIDSPVKAAARDEPSAETTGMSDSAQEINDALEATEEAGSETPEPGGSATVTVVPPTVPIHSAVQPAGELAADGAQAEPESPSETEERAGKDAGAEVATEELAEEPPPTRIMPEWKVLEPEDRSDAVEHEVYELLERSERWQIMAASVRGKLHAHKALWREDAYACGWVDDWTIIVVSDGAGSAPLSRIGARVACDESLAELKKLLAGWEPQTDDEGNPSENELIRLRSFLVSAATKAQEGILRESQKRNCNVKMMHATLLLMVHVPVGDKELVAAIQVGDGAVGIYSNDGTCTLLGIADHGEYSSETRFLTTPHIEREFERRVLFSIKQDVRCLAAMCDGVADDFFPEDKRLVELFVGDPIAAMETKEGEGVRGVMHEVIPDPQAGKTLLDWLKYEKKASSDDRTLVLMYRSSTT